MLGILRPIPRRPERRALSVGVDVDGLRLYHAIHGLPPPRGEDPVWQVGVPRLLDLLSGAGLSGTFFLVASDLSQPANRRIAEEIVRRGHEVASHTFSHPYDLVHRTEREIRTEIERAEGPLGGLRGRPVSGFRAPGYNVSAVLLRVLAERGYSYDSSSFPCPAYYAARAAAIGIGRLMGRRSSSIPGDLLRAPFRSRHPVLLDTSPPVVELPISVVPGVRFPLIGTSLALMGPDLVRLLGPVLRRMCFVNIELHGIDLVDASDIPGSPLLGLQPDLVVQVSRKRAAFEEAFRAAGRRESMTLEAMARELRQAG